MIMQKSHLVQIKTFFFFAPHQLSVDGFNQKRLKLAVQEGMHFYILKTIIAQGC